MGLDQYAGLRDSKGEVHEKFYWRKHARLQVFMSKQFNKQKKVIRNITHMTTCNIWVLMVVKVVLQLLKI
jgi:hypothetical protein